MYRLIKNNILDKKNHTTIIYILAAVYPFLVNLILIPIYFSLFGNAEKEYAIISIVSISQSYLVATIMVGLDMAFVKYFLAAHPNEKESKNVTRTFLSTLFMSILVNTIVYYLFSNVIFNYFWKGSINFNEFQWLIFISALFTVMNQSTFQYYRVKEKPIKALLAVVLPFTFFGIGGIVFMLLFEHTAYYCILGRTMMLGLASIPFFISLMLKYGITFRINQSILNYAVITFLGVFIEIVSGSIDKITIARIYHHELEIFGVYSLAFIYVTSVGFLITGYINAQTPTLFKALTNPDSEATKQLVIKFTYSLIILSCLINSAIFLFADVVALVLTTSNRIIFVKFVLLLIPINLLRMLSTQYNTAIYFYSKTIWFSVSTIAYILTFLMLNYVLWDTISIQYLPILVVLSSIPSLLIMRSVFNKHASYVIEEGKAVILIFLFFIVLLFKYLFGINIESVFMSFYISFFLLLIFLLIGFWILKKEVDVIL